MASTSQNKCNLVFGIAPDAEVKTFNSNIALLVNSKVAELEK
jgi:hypothetical protein